MRTLEELKTQIKNNFDEIQIIEELKITPEDLVERFSERIEDNYDRLSAELEEYNNGEE